MGYGDDSRLKRLFRYDYLVRIVYGLLVSVPFVILGVYWSLILLPLAYSVKAGGFKINEKYDFLWEDLIRFTVIGFLITKIGG